MNFILDYAERNKDILSEKQLGFLLICGAVIIIGKIIFYSALFVLILKWLGCFS